MVFQTDTSDTICALSTAPGVGAIATIRVSGSQAFSITEKLFSKTLADKTSHTLHYGTVHNGHGVTLDDVVVAVFKGPNSFTGEDSIEVTCHGSVFIQQEILQALVQHGARLAKPGEYTMRAFMNGKMDLSQAEAVADLIASGSAAAHKIAMHQMKGGFSKEISTLREQLINFASLIELELDFSEEDVEFADRTQLHTLLEQIQRMLKRLIESFSLGNAIKSGVPVAIVGPPNAGKSTLLNVLLNEDKAIVSDIAGTTRDVIEDTINIEGISFRFIDTAGIRETEDKIESLGIERSYSKAKEARVVFYLIDPTTSSLEQVQAELEQFEANHIQEGAKLLPVINKQDISSWNETPKDFLSISAKNQNGIEQLKAALLDAVQFQQLSEQDVIVSNMRHYEALNKALEDILNVQNGLHSGISGDFLAIDIRRSLHHLGEITGEITTDDLLGNIFSKFCIGK